MSEPLSIEQELIRDIVGFEFDPFGFVMYAYPWGVKGTDIENETGPREWQVEVLKSIGDKLRAGGDLGEVVQEAIASGHGIGKSALIAWVSQWGMATHPDTRGTVTANTETQLRTKTWPEISKWFEMLICRHWFQLNATSMVSRQKGHEKTWRIDIIPWSESNTEAFAGLHNKGKRILILFDEASAIPDKLWEVTEGVTTDEDTQIIWCAFGNPTKTTGRFRQCFTTLANMWGHRNIDSRTVPGTNKARLDRLVEAYGEDSDFVRVRVRGEFPRASSMQFIENDIVERQGSVSPLPACAIH